MKMYLIYNQKTVFDFEIHNKIFDEQLPEREYTCLAYAKLILDNLSKRLDKRFNPIKIFNDILSETIKHFEDEEEYEKCWILKQIRDSIDNPVNREIIKTL